MKNLFERYIYAKNVRGSGKAHSYMKALVYLDEILQQSENPFQHIHSIWTENNVDTIYDLYKYILKQQKNEEIFKTSHPSSYYKSGYYSAALKEYFNFLIEYQYEVFLKKAYKKDFSRSSFEMKLKNSEIFKKKYGNNLGKDKIRQIKTRIGQRVFRQKILEIYNNTCCITGLNIPELNRASHIIPWAKAKNEKIRMDPSNGLCLSGTYDIAFDKYIISLDEDYRIILSKKIKEYYTNEVTQDLFRNIEGKKIILPNSYHPKQEYLEEHRKLLNK